MTKAERLAALDREFDSQINRAVGTLKRDEYDSRRREIEAEPNMVPFVPTPAPAAAPAAKLGVSREHFEKALNQLADLIRQHTQSKLGPVEQHVRGMAHRLDATQAKIAELEAKLAEQEAKHTSAQRQLSRHSEHLSKLEDYRQGRR